MECTWTDITSDCPPKFFAYIVMFTVCLIGFQLANQMEEVVSRRRERLFSLGERMQPMVVVVGELGAISSAYVVLDDARWQVQTALKAVDICFKAFHVLHAQYPVESNVWMLLQASRVRILHKMGRCIPHCECCYYRLEFVIDEPNAVRLHAVVL
jgi:hypothetical protein